MKPEDKELLETFQVRFRDLMTYIDNLLKQMAEMEEKAASDIRDKDREIESLKTRLYASEKRYADLKTAKTLELTLKDRKDVKQRVDRLMREIDKCIALLGS